MSKTGHQLPTLLDSLSAAMLETGARLEVSLCDDVFAWRARLVKEEATLLEAVDSTPELAIAELNRKAGAA